MAIAIALVVTGALALPVAVGSGFAPASASNAAGWQRAAAEATEPAPDAAQKGEELRSQAATLAALVVKPPVTKTPTPLPEPATKTVKRRTSTASSQALPGGWRTARVSWYGPGFYGNTMAGGGKLTPSSMVVAHRSLPFGTKIQFQYKGRSCTAVVRDRGPYVGGRVFDLGPGTAKALGFSGVGTVKYKILG